MQSQPCFHPGGPCSSPLAFSVAVALAGFLRSSSCRQASYQAWASIGSLTTSLRVFSLGAPSPDAGKMRRSHTSARQLGYFRWNPNGFIDCHRQLSRHMASRSLWQRQDSTHSAAAGSATLRAASPSRRPAIRQGIVRPEACSNAATTCLTV